jgi:hypothetical protein
MSSNVRTPLLSGVNRNAPPVKLDSKVGLYIVLGVIFIMAALGLVAFVFGIANLGKVDKMNQSVTDNQKKCDTDIQQAKSQSELAAANMKRGSQGPPGIQGPAGPTGGIHAGAGPLLCVGQKKVATPVTGTSPFSIIYLDDRRYTPIQYWTLRNNSDGTVSIVNKFTGNCMTASTNTSDIYSDKCAEPVPLTQKFNWGPNMQLSSVAQSTQCLSVQNNFAMTNSNSNNKYDLNTMTEQQNSNNGSVTQLKLMECSQSQNLDQTWWIGN